MRPFSLEGKLAALLLLCSALAIGVGTLAARWLPPWYAVVATLAVMVLPSLWLARRCTRPIGDLMRTLAGSVSAFRDGDFSFSIANQRRDELGDLVDAHNELGRVLREQRQGLFQRELLLDSVVQNTPDALVLVEPGGHVVYANLAARALLNGGRAMNGERLERIVDDAAPEFARALETGGDVLFGVSLGDEHETFHLSQRRFKLQGRTHRMLLVKRLTRELSRQEVATWKKVIRVISHELNNSLAPIQSLAHSGRELARRGDLARLGVVFDTIGERTRHLDDFIQGYAGFARLPLPQPAAVEWQSFLDSLARHSVFRLAGAVPSTPGWFDPAQVEQMLINLVKNAHESGSPPGDVELAVENRGHELRIEVLDRGPGLSETVLAHALLPFYSTKRSGTGLGLALAREISEAHGGRVSLANRADGGLIVVVSLPQ